MQNRPHPPNLQDECLEDRESPSRYHQVWEQYKHYLCAFGGAFVGGVSVFIGMTFLETFRPANPAELSSVSSSGVTVRDRMIVEAEQIIRILESIALDKGSEKHFEAIGMMSKYQECLKDCAKTVVVVEESDKALLVNCRRECIAKFSDKVKNMRQGTEEDTN